MAGAAFRTRIRGVAPGVGLVFKDSFPSGVPTGWTTTNGTIDNTTGRNGGGATLHSDAHLIYTAAAGDQHSTWTVGMALTDATGYTDDTDADDFGLVSFCADGGATCHIYVGFSSNAPQIHLGQRGTVLATSSTTLTLGAWNYVIVQVTLGTSGAVTVWQGVGNPAALTQTVTYSGNTVNGGTASVFDTVKVGGFYPQNPTLDDFVLRKTLLATISDPGDTTNLTS